LQQKAEQVVPYLCRIFTAYLAYGLFPKAWRQVNVTFIPKPRKSDYAESKACRPISLSSFLSKTMEKLADRHIRDGVLKKYVPNWQVLWNCTSQYGNTHRKCY
jgi:hypothetical protein